MVCEEYLTYEWNPIRKVTNKGEVFEKNKFKARIKENIGRKIEFRKLIIFSFL